MDIGGRTKGGVNIVIKGRVIQDQGGDVVLFLQYLECLLSRLKAIPAMFYNYRQ